jgi:histone-lysine N-methyltransferase SETMAR
VDDSVKDQDHVDCVFDCKGTIHYEFVTLGQVINKQLYQEVLARLTEVVRKKRREPWENQTWILHNDIAPAHTSLLISNYLAKHQTSAVPHPPYSPDLTPADLSLFSEFKTTLKGRRFQTTEEIQEHAIRELRAITYSAFQEAFQYWKQR